ncbi:MAG TPA: long-chain fatty acid--CoA ligase [Myxococcales bacterium]|nr:long-chain fatty acid--CoA ligase [Myxococcales bacterium]
MDGLMMNFPLTLAHIFDRAGRYFSQTEVVSRRPDKSIHRTNYGEFHQRTQKLSNALVKLGVKEGERVATLAWNHSRHLEVYFGAPLMGGVLHTLNPRLSAQDLTYIMNHAQDAVLFVDDCLLPVFEKFRQNVKPRHIVVFGDGEAPAGTIAYEQLIGPEKPAFSIPKLREEQAAGLCYTSGTTGKPKGVLYSHKSLVLHSLAAALPDSVGASQQDVILPVVPMFHVNAWGIPFIAPMVGSKLVFPGPHLDPASLLQLVEDEKVTCAAGVPTVWLAILEALDKEPGRWNTKSLQQMVVGGSAAPQSMIEAFEKRHGLHVLHAWGMTEMSPIGTICRLKPRMRKLPESEQFRVRATQGFAVPLVEVRAIGENGNEAPWDGKSMGELHVRGPFIARQYFENPAEEDKFTRDGWFRTGDVVTIDGEGFVRITDRSKDLIKSGGEWISSVDLESALMGHPAVKEAAVVAVYHPKWAERPVACVVLKEGAKASEDELRAFLGQKFAKFQLPDAFVFMPAIPRTATGKFLKTALREQLKEFKLG